MISIEKICRVVFELAILLTMLVALLLPLHASNTIHFSVIQTVNEDRAVFKGHDSYLKPGVRIPIYRQVSNFNRLSPGPIGVVEVNEISDNTFTVSYNPSDFSWPFGRHGQIVNDGNGGFAVTLGSDGGFKTGNKLAIFADRHYIGEITLTKVAEKSSSFDRPDWFPAKTDNLTASEFYVATQGAFYYSPWLSFLEWAFIIALLASYALVYFRLKRSPLVLLGSLLKEIWLTVPERWRWWYVNIFFSIPFVWFVTKLFSYLFLYVISAFFSRQFSFGELTSLINPSLPYLYFSVGCLYLYYLLVYKRSPIIAFWRFLSYKKRIPCDGTTSRLIFVWCLNIIIIFAFSSTVLRQVIGNLQAIYDIGWPVKTPRLFFNIIDYSIWNLTIVAGLFGYCHSALGIIWGKYIRNVDFTVTGWLTNGLCYVFLFAPVIWQMVPPLIGIDPVITSGPLQIFTSVLGTIISFLFLLTIINLGTMISLMTDKGVRKSGFYGVVRHPIYTMEILMFFVLIAGGLSSVFQWMSFLMLVVLYWLRSEREDNFMTYSNPEYEEYKHRTVHKFIPGIY